MSVVLLAILSFSVINGLFSEAINCETILATSTLAVPPALVLEDVVDIAIYAYLRYEIFKTNYILKRAIFMPTLEALAKFRPFDESELKSDQNCGLILRLLQRAFA
jgi:hypothetical protein